MDLTKQIKCFHNTKGLEMFINDVFIKKTDDLIAFWDRFVVPMLKDKQHMRTYGEMTFFLEQEIHRERFGINEYTFEFDYEEVLNAFNKFKAIENPMERAHYFWEYTECDENSDLAKCAKLVNSIGVYMQFPRSLVKKGVAKQIHGCKPRAHENAGLFKHDWAHYCWAYIPVDWMSADSKDNPISGFLKIMLLLDNKKFTINGKEYKNTLLVQKKLVGHRRICDAQAAGAHILTHTDYLCGNVDCLKIYGSNLWGDAQRIYGDVSHISGEIHPCLFGDVSGLSGNITNVFGDATGIVYNFGIKKRKNQTDIRDLLNPDFLKNFTLLSNEENQKVMLVWNTLSHHTIGITDEERALFDHPVKCKPPFSIDKWGRHYILDKSGDYLWVFSINPADIMFAKDVNKCSTCFCINSNACGGGKWDLGMRCLIALNSVNPNLGVAFKIKHNSIKKMNQFEKIKFKWYEPEEATFFQYTSDKVYIWCEWDMDSLKLPFKTCEESGLRGSIMPIYGHDGINVGHTRQKELAYLETFIKDGYKWYRGEDKDFPLTNNYEDFDKDKISDEWKRQIGIANEKAANLIKMLKGE